MSVGPTRGPVQRPGRDRDLAELFQRVEDLERNLPVIPQDYKFVDEQRPDAFTGDLAFAVPDDARHLVIEAINFSVDDTFLPKIQFNGDTAAHYRTLATITEDLAGTITETHTSTTPDNTAIYLLGAAAATLFNGYPSRLVIQIPYYLWTPGAGHFTRSLECELWLYDNDPGGIGLRMRHAKIAGWWDPDPGFPADPLTSIQIHTGSGIYSLYKIR